MVLRIIFGRYNLPLKDRREEWKRILPRLFVGAKKMKASYPL